MPLRSSTPREQPPPELVELLGDDDNLAVLAPTETLLANLPRAEAIGLELVGERAGGVPVIRTLLRVGGAAGAARVAAQLQAVFPQATPRWWRPGATAPDPAIVGPDEQAAACELRLAHPGYEPLVLPRDRDQDPRLAPQADPLLGVLAALGSLPSGWRGLAQLVVRRAPDGWAEPHRARPAIDPTAERLREAARERWSPAASANGAPALGTSATLLLTVLAVLGLVEAVGLPTDPADPGQLPVLLLYGLALVGPAVLVAAVAARLRRPALTYDPALVREKLAQRAFYRAQLRLAVVGPATVAPRDVAAALDRLADAYGAYDQPLGNRFCRRPLRLCHPCQLAWLSPIGGRRRDPWRGRDVLGVRELAGLWHPTVQAAGLAGVARRGYPTRLPTPTAVAGACRIGVSPHHGLAVPVAVPDAVLDQHLFLLAGTQQGKSSLLLRLAAHLMAWPDRTLVVVDPHHRLGWAVLGLAPPARHAAVVYLDAANTARPFGLNLLDAGLFASCDGAVEGLLRLMEKQFPMAWGVRMEDAFRAAARLLFQLNQQRLAAAVASGIPAVTARTRQFTVLAITDVITDQKARAALLAEVGDDRLSRWWARFERKHPHLRDEIVNPVTGKIDYFALTDQVSAILGQPCSTIDPRAWLARPSIVIVHTALGDLKEAMAGLLGGTLINLLAQLALERGRPTRSATVAPPRLTLLVDEFQTMPGGDYRTILSQLAKFGVNVALATQTLSVLEADQGRGRASLRAEVFGNTGGWFCFRGDPIDDHRAVAAALGGGLTAEDLNNLPAYHCYARWSVDGERPPAFLVALDPPPVSDPGQAWALADASAQRYGRDPALIAGWRQATLPQGTPPVGRRHGPDTVTGPATRGQPPPTERSSAARALPVDGLAPGAGRAITASQRRRGRRPSPAPPTQSALPLGTPLPGTRLVPPHHPNRTASTSGATPPTGDPAALADGMDDEELAAAAAVIAAAPAPEPVGDHRAWWGAPPPSARDDDQDGTS